VHVLPAREGELLGHAIRMIRHCLTTWQSHGGGVTLPYTSADTAGLSDDLAAFHVVPMLIAWQETGEIEFRECAEFHAQKAINAYDVTTKHYNQKHFEWQRAKNLINNFAAKSWRLVA